MAVAIIQWVAARDSLLEFQRAGYGEWTIEHAFMAEMGGFLLQTNDSFPTFPVDGKQLLYLLKTKAVAYPRITVEAIRDKNKSDSLLRLITITQVLWFFIGVCGRAYKGLAVTCLEVNALALMPCTLCILFVWRHKSNDVQHACVIESPKTIFEIVEQSPASHGAISASTPLDFISRQEWFGSQLWSHYTNVMRCPGITFDVQRGYPADRMRLCRMPTSMTGLRFWVSFAITMTFVGARFIPWNFTFPT